MRLILLLVSLPLLLWAQPEFFGYFESQATAMQVGGKNYEFGFNKFRLDVEARPSDNVLIGANINIQKYWGKTTWDLLDFIPEDIWRPYFLLNPYMSCSGPPEMLFMIPDTILLDNVYMKVSFPLLDVTLGRQQISPGAGYAWNPTDIFNTKTLMDPSYEQTGVPAIRMEIPLDDRTMISAVAKPDEKEDELQRQFWFKSGASHFDIEMTVAEFLWTSNYSANLNTGSQDKRTLYGITMVGELFGWGLWTELANNLIEYKNSESLIVYGIDYSPQLESFHEILIGLDHTFDNSLYILGEYLYNGYGVAKKSDLQMIDYIQSMSGNTHSLMQDYGFLYLMHPTFDYVSLSAIVFANLNDQSGVFSPQLDWNVFQDTNLSVQGSIAWGEDDTEFGLQDLGIIVNIMSNF